MIKRCVLLALFIILNSSDMYCQLVDFAIMDHVANSVNHDNRVSFVYSSHIYVLGSDKEHFQSGDHLANSKYPRVSQVYMDAIQPNAYSAYRPIRKEKYVEYEQLGEKYIRREYSGSDLVSEAEVNISHNGWDLTRFKHPIDSLDFIWRMVYHEYDFVDGQYKDYHSHSSTYKEIKSAGNCIDGTKVGEWKYHNRNEAVIVVLHYDNKGKVDGKYYEYYYDRTQVTIDEFPEEFEGSFTLKTEGQYGPVDGEVKKIGTWNYYSKEGEKIGMSKMEWNKE